MKKNLLFTCVRKSSRLIWISLIFFLPFYPCVPCFSQDIKLAQITPKSPNIANLEKFTDVPVGLGSGTVNLQIPIYEIQVGSLTIPITLSHHNNGLKTDDIPSWVGHGWSLSTGGYISYQQNGLNDFNPQNGLFPNGLNKLNRYFSNQMSTSEKKDYFEDIINENLDSEHDQYNYNFPGNNGTFHFTNENTSRTNPKADIKVSKTPLGFKIIDDLGNTFFFESQESIISVNQESYDTKFSGSSSFYVSKIITSDKKIVNFSYKSYSLQYTKTTSSLSFTAPNCSSYGGPSSATILTTINYLLPDEITFPSGSVKFTHSPEVRADLLLINANTTARYLKGVSIFNSEGKIKEFSFDMDYFGLGKRLKLNSVAEVYNNQMLKHWDFEYYQALDGNYPEIFSKSKDHWGYYNGKSSINNLPRANYSQMIYYYNNAVLPSAIRTSDFNFAKIGMIKSIRYPAGGRSDFEYEQNQFVFNSYADFPFAPFLEPANENLYTVTIAGGNATAGNTLTGSFTIPSGGAFYKFNCWRILSPDIFYNSPEIAFTGPNNTTAALLNSKVNQCNFSLNQCTFSDILFLEEGTYYYTIQGSSYPTNMGDTYYLYAGFDLLAREITSANSYPVGGGRVSKVTSSVSLTGTPLLKKYIYNDSLSHVSLKSIPFYISNKNLQKTAVDAVGSPRLGCSDCGDLVTIWEESVKPMVGPSIEYGLIEEVTDEYGEYGVTENYLNFSENLGAMNTPPIVVPINTSWTAGSLIKQNFYEKNISGPRQENSQSYLNDYLGSQVNGIRVSYDRFCNGDPVNTTYLVNPTTVYSGIFKPSLNVKKEFYNLGLITSNEVYSYNLSMHQKPAILSHSTSDILEITQRTKYVFDYDDLSIATDDAALGLKRLKEANMNLPIEELSIKKIAGMDHVTGGILRTYKHNQTVVDEIYILTLENPLPLSSFIPSSINSSGVFVRDSRYILKVKHSSYHPQNYNLQEQHLFNGSKICYLYSYNEQLPIAEIVNADYSAIESILTAAGIEAFGQLVTPSAAEINNFIAPLRSGLPNAQITTYAYKPLMGMTSMTDAKGMTTFYEYDSFNRLKHTKDQNGNIIKAYDYHYKP